MRRSDRRTSARIGGRGRHTRPVRKARDPRGMAGVPATAGGRGAALLLMLVSVSIWEQ